MEIEPVWSAVQGRSCEDYMYQNANVKCQFISYSSAQCTNQKRAKSTQKLNGKSSQIRSIN